MQTLLQNLRFSLRMLRKSPGLTLTVLLTLALGIGANTAIFTVDYAALLAPMPYPQSNQLVVVWSKIQGFHNGVSCPPRTLSAVRSALRPPQIIRRGRAWIPSWLEVDSSLHLEAVYIEADPFCIGKFCLQSDDGPYIQH